ncbi:FHA domain-containing protein [Vibrio sp. PP-XX7]
MYLTDYIAARLLPLIGQQWLIGTEEEADLILFDPGIKPRHCQLALRDNRWILTSEQGKMTDPEGHLVEEIAEQEEMGPQLVFALDGIWMTIVDAATPWPEESHEAIIPIEPEEEKIPLPKNHYSLSCSVS